MNIAVRLIAEKIRHVERERTRLHDELKRMDESRAAKAAELMDVRHSLNDLHVAMAKLTEES